MKITRFTFLLFAFFVYDSLHHFGLSKNTYKSWSLRNSLISHRKRKSISIANSISKVIYKFIKDKADISAKYLASGFSEAKEFMQLENNPIVNYRVANRMCING